MLFSDNEIITRLLDAERRLTGKELSSLAEQMVKTSDPAEQAMVREAIARGFYGQRQHA